ncbi:MAG: TonB-dependent receptor [Steroidobacteraceae bacterium]
MTRALLLAALTGATAAALADDAASNTASSFELGTVEIIGTRPAAATALTTDSVDAATLAAQHRDDLSQALDLVPGVAVQNTGQRRERLISLRGFSSRQVPLFIDGVPVYVPYDGNVDLARFGVDYVSEIIVSKGLASLLYGPNVLGGAINVVSRKPVAPLEMSARAATESDGSGQHYAASIGGLQGNWYGNLTASYAQANGYALPSDFTPTAAENGGQRDNAFSRDLVVSAKVGFAPDADNEYALSFYRQDGRKDDPPYAGSYLRSAGYSDGVQVRYWQWPYWNKQSLYFVARNAIGAQGTLRWRLFHDSFKNALESYDDATYTTQTRPYAFHGSHYDDHTDGANADFEWRWNDAQTTRLATHYRNDVHTEAQLSPYSPEEKLEIPTYDFAAEHEWRFAPEWSVTPSYSHMVQSARTVQVYDDTSASYFPVSVHSAAADNGQLIGTWSIDAGKQLLAGVSRKTRFPTLKERFSGGLGSAVPNPDLDPETALHYEVAYQQRGTGWSARLALFQSDLSDAIQSVTVDASACSSPPCTQLRNVAEQRNRGVEFSFDYAPIRSLQLNGQVNVVHIDNRSDPDVKITGTPEYKYLLAANWSFAPRWQLRADADHESSRYSNSTGTRVAGAFTLLNSFLRFTPVRQIGVEVGARNLTDALYAYEEGYYEPGRTWLAQVDYRY